MPDFSVKGHAFTAPTRYTEGHRLTSAESETLNRLVQVHLRSAILNRIVTTRQEAEAFVLSDKALEAPDARDGNLSLELLL